MSTRFLSAMLVIAVATLVWAEPPDARRIEQIAGWMAEGAYSPTPSSEDRDFWQKVGRSQNLRGVVQRAETAAPLRALPDDLYLEYSRNGTRTRYQNVYFAKLDSFRRLVIAECIEHQGRFLAAIEQAVASYAADKTWVLPAHDGNLDNFTGRQITIDLFSSEVACELATADFLLRSQLAAATRALIRQETKRRVLDPYQGMVKNGKPPAAWLNVTNNWNAVCLANVTGTALAMLERAEDRAFYVASAEKHIDSFLRGFTDDGYCSEGIGYWNYGFGCFVRLGHMLHGATGGHLDLFALPKVKNAGLFARRMELAPGQYPAFADCTVGATPSREIMRYVTRRFNLTPTAWEQRGESQLRWLDELGVFAFVFDPPGAGEQVTAEPALRDFFQEAGILVCRGARTEGGLPLAVSLKGGHNAEHHNHNDVGSYVVCVGDSLPLVDPGAEEYTRRTFSRDRYVSGVLNSFGHPVPRVAGKLQDTGRSAAARLLAFDVSENADHLAFDLSSAYSVKALKKLTRTFVYQRKPASLSVCDEVAFETPESFGTAVITFGPWQQVAANRLRVGQGAAAVEIAIDTENVPFEVKAEEIKEDVRGGKTPIRLGIDLSHPIQKATVRIVIEPAASRSHSAP